MAPGSELRGIHFGTDGWRDVIAEGFTFDRVRLVAWAVVRYMHRVGLAERGLAVGYDARFLSDRFAGAVAEVAVGSDLVRNSFVWRRAAPTPALACFVAERDLGGGLMVTASHNPPEFNGLKFKPSYGGSATEAITRPIEEEANRLLAEGEAAPVGDLERALSEGRLERVDPLPGYLERLAGLVDIGAISRAGLAVAVDPMHGAAREVLPEVLRAAGCRRVQAVRTEPNPGFGGVNPEPIAANLRPLMELVASTPGLHAGLAVDGDGDRIGAVDERGRFVNAHQILALLIVHLVENRGLRGELVRSLCTTSMVDRLGERYNLPVVETAVGFKHICERMLQADVLIGGEESGGIGIRGHIPERDGTLSALLLAEMMARTGLTLGALVRELERRVGPHHYGRLDLPAPAAVRVQLVERMRALKPERLDGRRVLEVKGFDGFKFLLEDGSWLMVRPSGTEPLVRVYAEAPDEAGVERLLVLGRQWVEQARSELRRG